MATFYGVNATKRDNQTIKDLEGQGETNSPLKIAFDSYTLTATKAQNDVIKMMKLPPKARVIDVIISWDASLDAAGGTLEVGWEANGVDAVDADGFLAAVDVTVAGSQAMQGDQGARPGVFKQFGNAETQVSLLVSHSGGLDSTSGTVNLCVMYVIS